MDRSIRHRRHERFAVQSRLHNRDQIVFNSADAPALRAASMISGSLSTEQITIGGFWRDFASSLVTSIPFNIGIARSKTAKSGLHRRIASKADFPSTAVSTTSNSAPKSEVSFCKNAPLSSARTIRSLFKAVPFRGRGELLQAYRRFLMQQWLQCRPDQKRMIRV